MKAQLCILSSNNYACHTRSVVYVVYSLLVHTVRCYVYNIEEVISWIPLPSPSVPNAFGFIIAISCWPPKVPAVALYSTK